MKKIFSAFSAMLAAVMLSATIFAVSPLPAAAEEALEIASVGVSGGTYATDSDSFTLPRQPDYGELTFDGKITEYLTDGKVDTFWEGTGNHGRNVTDPVKDEYVIVDLGDIKRVSALSLTASGHGGFPQNMTFEYAVSDLNKTRTIPSSRTSLDSAPEAGGVQTVKFDEVIARYIRINVSKIFRHTTYSGIHGIDIYDVCVADVAVYGGAATEAEKQNALEGEADMAESAPVTVTTSSELNASASAKNLYDGSQGTYWCSAWSGTDTPACYEELIIDFGKVMKLDKVALYPRNSGDYFPRDFTFSYGVLKNRWTSVESMSQKGYAIANTDGQEFAFPQETYAQYVRLLITGKSTDADNSGTYLIQLGEIKGYATEISEEEAALLKEKAQSAPETVKDFFVDCSSFLDTRYGDGTYAYDPANLLDKNMGTLWYNSFSATSTEVSSEYAVFQPAYEDAVVYNGIILYAQGSLDFFPRDFAFQYSFDGVNWLDADGQVYTDYTDSDGEAWEKISSPVHRFVFGKPVVAKYLRLHVTKKSGALDAASGSDYYMIALSEAVVEATTADAEQAKEAEKAFYEAVYNRGGQQTERESVKIILRRAPAAVCAVVCAALAVGGVGITIFALTAERRKKHD